MNQIAGLLPVGNILLDLEAANKKRIFEQVGLLFENNHGISRNVVYDSLFAREKLGSTGLGQGIAIPHGRIHGLVDAIGAYARLRAPVPFDAPDGKPVQQLFVLLVPEHATDQHLQLLSELAQMFSERMFRERLMQAPDVATVDSVFRDWKSAA